MLVIYPLLHIVFKCKLQEEFIDITPTKLAIHKAVVIKKAYNYKDFHFRIILNQRE